MISTDFKGITWVGDIYQKFETLCLELEEDMYRDTVEYVEDQVQTVGASVKKLYSDVLQDLTPVTVADLSLNPCTDFGIYKKPKASINEDRIKVDKQVAKDSKMIAGVNADHTSFFSEHQNVCHFLRPSSLGLIKGGRSELCSEKNEDKDTCEYSNVDIKIKSKRNNHPSSAMLWPITPGSKDLIRASLCHQLSNNHDAVCDHKVMTLCSASVEVAEGHSRGGKFCNNTVSSAVSIADAAIDIPTSDEILPIESCVKKETKLSTYINGGSGGFSAQSNGTCTNSGGISPIELYACGDAQYIESAIEEDVSSRTGRSGNCNLDLVESNGIAEPRIDIIEQFDDSKLEETCVLVDRDKLCIISNTEDKPRSYKKKIQKAFSSKRSARKQEYEQLAVQYGDTDTGRSNHTGVESLMLTLITMDAVTKKLSAHDFCESEWELL
ncbi:hypothetical protein CsSME_00019818 [Camellia sinensis var. sinensis]